MKRKQGEKNNGKYERYLEFKKEKVMRKFLNNSVASAVPLILFLLTIVSMGALYTLFFIEIGYPLLDTIIVPDSDSKTFIMMCMYAIPLVVLIVGVIALLMAGLKRTGYPGGFYG